MHAEAGNASVRVHRARAQLSHSPWTAISLKKRKHRGYHLGCSATRRRSAFPSLQFSSKLHNRRCWKRSVPRNRSRGPVTCDSAAFLSSFLSYERRARKGYRERLLRERRTHWRERERDVRERDTLRIIMKSHRRRALSCQV